MLVISKKEIYKMAYKELENRRLSRKILQEKNIEKAFEICPEIEILYKNINLTSMYLAKTIYSAKYKNKILIDNSKAITLRKNINITSKNLGEIILLLKEIEKEEIISKIKLDELYKNTNLTYIELEKTTEIKNNQKIILDKAIVVELFKNINLTLKKLEKLHFEEYNSNEIESKLTAIYSNIFALFEELKSLIYSSQNNRAYVINKIKNENILAQKEIEKLLIKNNMPKNFLNPEPYCNKCEDYGIVKNERCECLNKLVKSIISKQWLKNLNPKKMSFSNFNLNYYSKTPNENNISAFQQMSKIYERCKSYAENFSKNSGGILMTGLTGLGKTHISIAIALKIIDRGFTAFYETACAAVRNLLNSRYSNGEEQYLNTISEADLLILDDLGSELKSQFNQSAIFEIINTRIFLNKPIIISTNLTLKELESEYSPRIISRIIPTLEIMAFIGVDNRKKASLEN